MNLGRLLRPLQVGTTLARSYGKHNKKYLYKDGKKYEGIIYYPRTSDHQDPPIEPAKLFRVQRIKPMKGNPFWEKRILKDLGLDGKQSDYTVVKNIPENNARLWKIKHLIKVTPVTFPYGEPTAQDVKYTILKDNGECLVTKDIGQVEVRTEAREAFDQQPKRLDTDLLRKDSRLKWLNPW
ncbi:GL14759 [Drosophila persimilis]|uniref:Large ribosomal subunit protein uL30m n=2 Tax=pseudoobscura subgroup TaxID=32358 RepID=A0A6I8W8G1_DROPS|nr:39S ribosomal protein L30, mitochondrial [Drosophila pseudoobscura]XP_002022799.1 39S ribosomal protein L30, mitochondrial [Drosophila persimilis]XP_033238909.1 39S ribosomal protein L30, mitochondrial [Drosophila pseudoobscura]EDW26865.1 GL14759 [Drosophila persimilis]